MGETPAPPTPEQVSYYLWLVLKRASYVLSTSTKYSLSHDIDQAYNANRRQGMMFLPMTYDERVKDARAMMTALLASAKKKVKA